MSVIPHRRPYRLTVVRLGRVDAARESGYGELTNNGGEEFTNRGSGPLNGYAEAITLEMRLAL